MINKYSIENFKSFARPATINLNDLIVIAGSNSGGKSTIIQSLLLLSQTLENPRTDVALDLGGQFVQFAEFREIVFSRPATKTANFSIGFDVKIDEANPLIKEQFLENYVKTPYFRDKKRQQKGASRVSQNQIKVQITFGANQLGTPIIKAAKYEKIIQGLGTIILHIERHRGKKYRVTKELASKNRLREKTAAQLLQQFESTLGRPSRSSGIRLRSFMMDDMFNEPLNYFGFDLKDVPEVGSSMLERVKKHEGILIDPEKLGQTLKDILIFTFRQGLKTSTVQPMAFDHFLLPSAATQINLSKTDAGFFLDGSFFPLLRQYESVFGQASKEIRSFLKKIKYIGPLRAKPERAYLSIGSPVDIGTAGENAAAILWLYQNDKVKTKTKIGAAPSERKLVEAVQDWMHEFGIGSSFHITKPKRVIYQAELESAPGSKTMVTIADVGFGVSQILPVIVAGLRAPEKTTLVLEQPEIHLHPKLQGKLADFIICLVELKKRIIVETHSEHLINMLRLRIAQDKTGELQNKVGVIFVRNKHFDMSNTVQGKRQHQKHGGSFIENLKLDQYGRIENWPPDFFPEAVDLSEEIIKAMMEKFPGGK